MYKLLYSTILCFACATLPLQWLEAIEVGQEQTEQKQTCCFYDRKLIGDQKALREFLKEMSGIFDGEKKFLKIGSVDKPRDFVIVGDLHGDLISFGTILQKYLPDIEAGRRTMVFLGDYVDRGPHSLEVLIAVLGLKKAYPDNVYLLRGNHEDDTYVCYESKALINAISVPGTKVLSEEQKTGLQKNQIAQVNDKETAELIREVYKRLPICAALNGTFLCVHGGIPNYDKSTLSNDVETIKSMDKQAINIGEKKLYRQLLWNDFSESPIEKTESESGRGEVSIEDLLSFLESMLTEPGKPAKKDGFLIRGHEHDKELRPFGEKWPLINVVSTLYLGGQKNLRRVLEINKDNEFKEQLLKNMELLNYADITTFIQRNFDPDIVTDRENKVYKDYYTSGNIIFPKGKGYTARKFPETRETERSELLKQLEKESGKEQSSATNTTSTSTSDSDSQATSSSNITNIPAARFFPEI